MRCQNQASSMTQSVLNRWQGFANAGVIHHSAVLEWHVEVNAHEDPVIIYWQITNRKLRHGWSFVERSAGAVPAVAQRGVHRIFQATRLHPEKARLRMLQALGAQVVDQVADAAGVSPLVVVP